MFARRHPILFSLLLVCAICAVMIISVAALFFLGKGDSAFEFGEKVGVVEINGVIADPKPVILQLKRFRKNNDVKAIVLRIDSPGGGVGPSQEIYEEVKKTTRLKKVVASMGAIAASGGYYVGAAADHIMANPGTITGSIGVVTLNLPRIGYLAKSRDQFFTMLERLMQLAKESLELKRKIVETNITGGLLPFTKRYLGSLRWHFSTIGLVGMNETCQNFLGTSIMSKEGKTFAIKVLT